MVLALNLAVPSLLNFYWRSPEPHRWERFLRYIIRLHGEVVGPFTRRPVTTALLHQAYLFFHDAWLAFLVVQGTLLTASAAALSRLARLEDGPRAAPLAQALYFGSFTILFSFVTPNDAFDEPAQYLFLFLSLYFHRRGLPVGFACAFFLAVLSRETSLLVLPGLLLLDPAGVRAVRSWPKYLIPVAAWAAFFIWKDAPGDPGRFFYWAKNFAGWKISFETLVSFGLALGLGSAVYFSALPSPKRKLWTLAFLITLALNTPIVLYAAYARESRLLALPLVFLWPRLGGALRESFQKKARPGAIAWLSSLAVSVAIWFAYHPLYRHVLGYRIYASLLPFLCLLFLARRRRQRRIEMPPDILAQ